MASIFACTPIILSAHDIERNGIFYNLNKAAKTATVTYFGDKNTSARYVGEVRIPSHITANGVKYAVTAIGSYAFSGCKKLTYIFVPATVKTIGKQAFKDCTGLKSVVAGDVEKYNKIKLEDEYSSPDRYTDGVVVVASSVRFTTPVIIKDDPEPSKPSTTAGETRLSTTKQDGTTVSITAPAITRDEPAPSKPAEQETEKDQVFFIDTPFTIEKKPKSTGIPAADRYAARLLFGQEYDNIEQAYDQFKQLWRKQGLDGTTRSTWRKISFSVDREYASSNQRFACYHVKASLSGSIQLSKVPQTQQGQMLKKQYFTLSNGVNHYFIVDLQKNELVGIDEAFLPAVAAKLKALFGDEVSLYAEDRCLQLLSSKGEGRFIFSQVSEKNFTDYFKQLVGWSELGNIPTPEFLHGQQGLNDYFRKSLTLASEKQSADMVTVSLIVREDGSVMQPTIEQGANIAPSKLLELCSKMPKWKPAYEGGKPVAREASFTLRIGQKVYDVVEQMPSFPGGQGALFQYMSSNIKYPEEAEENGRQGRVICSFVVERNGDITDVSVVKSVDPDLDNEAVRVISSMPRWIPGRINGKPVRVKYSVPVTFRLQ
jgi:TonB family protein